MKKLSHSIKIILVLFILIASGCASKQCLKIQPQQITDYFKHYQCVTVLASTPTWTYTNFKIEKEDKVLILTSGDVDLGHGHIGMTYSSDQRLILKIGNGITRNAVDWNECSYWDNQILNRGTGNLKFIVKNWPGHTMQINPIRYRDNSGSFRVHVFVIDKSKDESILPQILKQLVKAKPNIL